MPPTTAATAERACMDAEGAVLQQSSSNHLCSQAIQFVTTCNAMGSINMCMEGRPKFWFAMVPPSCSESLRS